MSRSPEAAGMPAEGEAMDGDRANWWHSAPAHVLLGWCASCKDRSWADELGAWRAWADAAMGE